MGINPTLEPMCVGCGKHPADDPYLVELAEEEGSTPDEYVRYNEGTYNPENGHYLCDTCYIKAGMPSSPYGWVAP